MDIPILVNLASGFQILLLVLAQPELKLSFNWILGQNTPESTFQKIQFIYKSDNYAFETCMLTLKKYSATWICETIFFKPRSQDQDLDQYLFWTFIKDFQCWEWNSNESCLDYNGQDWSNLLTTGILEGFNPKTFCLGWSVRILLISCHIFWIVKWRIFPI